MDDNTFEKINILNDFLKSSNQGFNSFKNKEFHESVQSYAKAVNLSKKISEMKQAETLLNLAISLYHLGKINESLENVESAYKLSEKLYNNDVSNLSEISFLYLRACANFSLTNLTLSNTEEALSYNNKSLMIIEKEPNPEKKVLLFRELVQIYFHIETTLEEYYEQLQNSRVESEEENEEEDDEQEEERKDKKKKNRYNKKINNNPKSKTLLLIHHFLRESDFSGWVKLLEENITFFKENSNIPAYIFSVLNHSVFNYIHTGKMDQTKTQLNNIIKSLKINGKLKSSEKILTEWKNKIECAIEMYRDILTLEESLSEKYLQEFDQEALDEKIKTNSLFIKILLKHTLRYLDNNDNYDKSIRIQIESTLKALNRRELDLSKFDVLSFDSEIISSIHLLFKNLITIKKKQVLYIYMKKMIKQTSGLDDFEEYRMFYNNIIRYRGLKSFRKKALESITTGNTLLKINYSSQGKVEHFYKISEEENALLVFKSKNSKSSNKYYFEKDIYQIKYGVKSKNLLKRYKDFKTPQLRQPWLYLSFQMAKSSIDLFMKEDEIVSWFFGIKELAEKKSLTDLKMMTCSGFTVKRVKLRLIQRLKEELVVEEKDGKGEEKEKESKSPKATSGRRPSGLKKDMIIVNQMKKFLRMNPLGLDQLSFAKVLLLYIKMFDVEIKELPSKD